MTSVLILAGLIVGSLFGDRGMFALWTQQEKVRALAEELQAIRYENSRLADEIVQLRTDPHSIEAIAREELGLAAPGETVFIFRRAR